MLNKTAIAGPSAQQGADPPASLPYIIGPETIMGVKVMGPPVEFRKHNPTVTSPPGARKPG